MAKLKNLTLLDKVSVAVTTLFGVGYTPLCPGTAACVVGVGVFLLVRNQIAFTVVTVISVIISFIFSSRAEKVFGEKDCKKIVIDDFSGQLITFLFFPKEFDILFIPAGFFLFRMLDMLKIPPADKIETYHGAKGIVGDDIVAGLYSLAILQLVRLLLNIIS
tara:strand:+ start:3108 stop:3593 length:486 start_codon:yes stop_codon:yes gene_type:complete